MSPVLDLQVHGCLGNSVRWDLIKWPGKDLPVRCCHRSFSHNEWPGFCVKDGLDRVNVIPILSPWAEVLWVCGDMPVCITL